MMSYGQFSRSHKYMSIWGFLPYPSIWTHHDTPVFAKTRGCGPITCCPSAGVGTPPLHKPVSSDGRFGGTKRANPQGMGSIPMMNRFFLGAWTYVYQVKLCGFNETYQGMFLLMPMIFERHGYMRFEKNTDNLHFFSIPDPERPSCWIASGFIRIQLSRDCCNPSSFASQSWIWSNVIYGMAVRALMVVF